MITITGKVNTGHEKFSGAEKSRSERILNTRFESKELLTATTQ